MVNQFQCFFFFLLFLLTFWLVGLGFVLCLGGGVVFVGFFCLVRVLLSLSRGEKRRKKIE